MGKKSRKKSKSTGRTSSDSEPSTSCLSTALPPVDITKIDYTICGVCKVKLPPSNWIDEGHNYKPCCGHLICKGCDNNIIEGHFEATDKLEKMKLESGGDQPESTLPVPYEIQRKISPDCHICGTPMVKTEVELVERTIRLANEGHAHSQHKLAYYCEQGEYEMQQSTEKACKLWESAATLGHVESQNEIAFRYKFGEGVPQSDKEAKYWYELAAHQGNAIAQDELGCIYRDGLGVEVDIESAKKLFLLAAEQDHPSGVYNYGSYLEDQGRNEEALEWFLKGANNETFLEDFANEIAFCQFNAARLLLKVYPDYLYIPGESKMPTILFWVNRAAKNGLLEAGEYYKDLQGFAWKVCANCGGGDPKVRCSACKVVTYCSKECQVGHWKAGHKVDCKSVPKDVTYPIMPTYWRHQCAYCQRDKPSLICSGCMCAYYCGDNNGECQKNHWSEGNHKSECKKIKKQASSIATS